MNYLEECKKVFELEIKELENLKDNLDNNMVAAINLMYNCKGKVIITGIGKTGIVGRKIAASLSSTGTHAVFLNSAEGLHGDLGIIDNQDIVVAISNSGNSPEIVGLMPSIKKIGSKIIVITGNVKSRLAKYGDVVISSYVSAEACPLNLAPTTSTTAVMVIGDALTVVLMKLRDFLPDNFALFHPGGSLGRRLLTKVEDVMIKSKLVATCRIDDLLLEVVTIMTKKNYGIVIVYEGDTIIGVITDGDIRRAINKFKHDFSKLSAQDIVTKNFKYVQSNSLAFDALSILEQFKIGSIPVIDNKIFVGLIRYHDLYEVR